MGLIQKAGPDQQRELFNRFCREANGFSSEDVIGAAINILVNGIRQAHSSSILAQASLDEKLATARALLVQHYDGNGKRVGITPFTQMLQVPHIMDKDRF